MAADKDNDATFFGRPRRSSFVAPAEENADFVPVLPPVGSTPIPAAADVNYFPTVATGQPSLREPEPPARLVVPSRKSMTEEEIATAFAEAAEMTSSEQIAMLDSQMTLRDDDLRTALEFVATLRTANPIEAAPLLDELKSKFADVDPQIADLTLGNSPRESDVDVENPVSVDTAASGALVAEQPADAPTPAIPVSEVVPMATPGDVPARYRGWNSVMSLAVIISTLVPLSFAVFTTFGAPSPTAAESLVGASGVFVLAVAVLAPLPLLAVARSVSVRHGLSWRSALQRVTGSWGGSVLSAIALVTTAVGLMSLMTATAQGVGLQLASIPGVTSAIASIAPHAHVTVLLVAALVAVGFAIAALPRSVYRAKMLALTGFIVVGPATVLFTNLAVIANTDSSVIVSADNAFLAMALVPMVVVIVGGVESGIATAVRRDEKRLHGLWLYIGLVLGIAFAAGVLLTGMGADTPSELLVGSNPALHMVAPSVELAFVIGAITFGVPVVFVAALIGRSLGMVSVHDSGDSPRLWIRLVIVAVPACVFLLDGLGMLGDLTVNLPGVAFVSVPLAVIAGVMAGASIASRRGISRGARVVNGVITTMLILVGWALTLWAVPGATGVFDALISPVAGIVGLGGATVLTVPAALIAVSFVLSLLVSAVGGHRSTETD